jgi:hypothetical protein
VGRAGLVCAFALARASAGDAGYDGAPLERYRAAWKWRGFNGDRPREGASLGIPETSRRPHRNGNEPPVAVSAG